MKIRQIQISKLSFISLVHSLVLLTASPDKWRVERLGSKANYTFMQMYIYAKLLPHKKSNFPKKLPRRKWSRKCSHADFFGKRNYYTGAKFSPWFLLLKVSEFLKRFLVRPATKRVYTSVYLLSSEGHPYVGINEDCPVSDLCHLGH